jgi:hypothetical protein
VWGLHRVRDQPRLQLISRCDLTASWVKTRPCAKSSSSRCATDTRANAPYPPLRFTCLAPLGWGSACGRLLLWSRGCSRWLSEAVSIFAQGPNDEEPWPFSSAAAGETAINAGYKEGVAGSFQFQLKAGEKSLQSAKAELAENASYTVLAWRQDDQWEFEVYADGPFAKSVVDRPLRLMNFADKRETLISIDNGAETKVAANRVEEFKVSAKLTSFTVKVLAADGGAPAESSGEVDFGVVPSAYVVIAPDYRGRMRPRVVAGGHLPSLEE